LRGGEGKFDAVLAWGARIRYIIDVRAFAFLYAPGRPEMRLFRADSITERKNKEHPLMKSIKTKLIVSILAVIGLPLVLIFFIASLNIRDLSQAGFEQSARGQLMQVDNAIRLFMDESMMNAALLAAHPLATDLDLVRTSFVDTKEKTISQPWADDETGQAVVEFFSLMQNTHPNYVEVFMGARTGAFVSAVQDSMMPAGYDPRRRPWYTEALAAGNRPSLSKAYMSTTGEAVASVTAPVVRGGEVLGVVGVDISLKKLTDMVESIRLGKTGYMVLLQDDGVVLADPRHQDFNFKAVGELPSKHLADLFAKGEGTGEYEVDGKRYLGMVVTSPQLGWRLVGLIERDEIMAPAEGTAMQLGLVVAACLVLVAAAVWLLTGRMVLRPVRQMMGFLHAVGQGDYSQRMTLRPGDEMGEIIDALHDTAGRLAANMEEITAKTREAEEKAAAAMTATEEAEQARKQAEQARREGMVHAARRLEAIVARVSSATEEMSSQSDEIRNGTDIQAERIAATATAMEEMNATVLEVARNSGEAASVGNEAKDRAVSGRAVVASSIEAMETTRKQAEELRLNMNVLGEKAEAIGAIMTVIEDIADQTNLLALNAAIEAARAGEAGRGFAVVADEVRKLAEKTMGATKEVGDSIRAIQGAAAENIDSMGKAVADLAQAVELSNQSGVVLDEIVERVERSAEQIQSIATAAEEQSATSEEINRAIDEINRITGDTARGVSESAAALSELAGQMSELAALIQELKQDGSDGLA